MNMNVSKTNGVKLLAAILVMAMVVAGAAVVLSDSTVSAENKTSAALTTAGSEITSAENPYYVSANVTITDAVTSEVNLYIAPNADIKITNESSSAKLNLFAATTAISNGTVQYDDGLKVVIAAQTNVDVTNKNGVITTTVKGTDDTIAGISEVKATNFTYYANGAIKSIELSTAGTTEVTVDNGTATIYQGSNQMKIVAADQKTATVAADASGIPKIATGCTATVSIESGVIASVDSLATALVNTVEASVSGTYYYSNQLFTPVGDVKEVTVYGNISQKTQFGNADVIDASKTDVTGITVKFAAAGTNVLTINNNVNVYVENITTFTNGSVVLYGSLYSATAVTGLPGEIGPNGFYSNVIFAAGTTNTNVTTGNDYVIYGVPSSPSVGDAILGSAGEVKGLTIPKNTTFTVTGNLGLNGNLLIVEGTLVIDNKGSIYGTGKTDGSEGIVIVGNGSIQNNGSIGKMMGVSVYYDKDANGVSSDPYITMQGVSGVDFAIDKNDGLTVSGNITAATGAKANNLTINGAVITGDFTTAKKVTLLLGDDVRIAKNAAVVLNGTTAYAASVSDKALIIGEGASVSVNGSFGVTLKAEVGILDDEGKLVEASKGAVTITAGKNVAGFTMYMKKVAVAEGDKTNYYFRAYVNGSIDNIGTIDKESEGDDETVTVTAATLPIYIAAGETLTVSDDTLLAMGKFVVEGTIVINNESNAEFTDYIGAMYGIDTAGENGSSTTTVYYTTLAAAMDKIADVNDEGITAIVDKLDINVTVADGQLLNLTVNDSISQTAVLTVQNGGTLTGEVKDVDGKMVIQPEANSILPGDYDVMSTSEDGTVTYAGIAVAIAEAPPGDKITIESATIGTAGSDSKESLTIPQGVEVTVTENLTINGDLTVAQGATLTGGSINMTYDGAKVTVNGTLDVSDGGSLTGTNFTLTSNGTTVVTSIEGLNFNGAYYTGDDGIVITTVANAVKYVAENEITTPVKVHGKVTDSADLVLDGVDVTLDPNAEVVLGNVTLTDATITSTGAKLTAVVTGMNGEGDAAVNGTVSVNKSAVVIDAAQVVNAAGTTIYTYTISAIDGPMTVQSGTVALKGSVSAAAESKFAVASGATLLVGKGAALTIAQADAEFTVDGTLEVDEGQAVFTTGKTIVINGTANISGNGSIEAAALVINGTVNVSATENDEGTFTVTGDNVTVGDAEDALGSTGSIVGIIGFTGTADHIIAYAGTDMTGAKMANDAEFETTAFYVNDALYATVYANGSIANDIITSETVSKLPGIDQNGDVTWATADGTEVKDVDDITIGQYDAVYAKAPLAKVTITVSMGSQISLFIDGVKPTGNSAQLTIGTHDVVATVNPGYAGEVTITFNGQTVTDGKIVITADMAGEDVVLSVTGNISVDTGSSGSSSDGMGLTEILLVILVILIVVMAIMVALRLMRS